MKIEWPDVEQVLAEIGEELDSLQLATAGAVALQHYPHLDPGQPVLLIGLADLAAARRLRDVLCAAYPLDWVVRVHDGQEWRPLPLANLPAALEYGRTASVLIPPLPAASSFQALQDVVAHLRAPTGCPWDQALTWSKLRATLLEETYELLSALDDDDSDKVLEEQGDLLVQIAMQAQIASEEGRFQIPDVINRIVTKLIRRHPHVFGDAVVSGTDDVLANWEAIKRVERQQNGAATSPLAGVPAGLPALAQADAYLERMSRLKEGDEPEAPRALLAGLEQGDNVTPEAIGEALFRLVGWARTHGVDAESALREVNARFAARVAAEGHG